MKRSVDKVLILEDEGPYDKLEGTFSMAQFYFNLTAKLLESQVSCMTDHAMSFQQITGYWYCYIQT